MSSFCAYKKNYLEGVFCWETCGMYYKLMKSMYFSLEINIKYKFCTNTESVVCIIDKQAKPRCDSSNSKICFQKPIIALCKRNWTKFPIKILKYFLSKVSYFAKQHKVKPKAIDRYIKLKDKKLKRQRNICKIIQ